MIADARSPDETVSIGPDGLAGRLFRPPRPLGLVLLGHAGEPGDPRAALLAENLCRNGLALLLANLLHPDEARDPQVANDVALLAARLFAVTEWACAPHAGRPPAIGPGAHARRPESLPLGYLAAGPASGAALLAASGPDRRIRAIVACGGRIDQAGQRALSRVQAPVRMIVGTRDLPAAGLGKLMLPRLSGPTDMILLPGVGPGFAEAGALAQLADHAAAWFRQHFAATPTGPQRAPPGPA